MLRRITLAAMAATSTLWACGETTTSPVSQLNLDRPVDVSFACYGGLRITNGGTATIDQEIQTTAQPIEACNVRSGPHDSTEPVPVPEGQENLTAMGGDPIPGAIWYAFILQSGPGTVALASFQTKPSTAFAGGDVLMLDADVLTPGKNGISVGEDPIAIAGDKSGCWQIIANAGSCDLSALEVNSAVAHLAADPGTDVNVHRLDVKNAAGARIDARPAAMTMAPPTTTIGEACPVTPTGIAYLSYPSCHLVAAVDLATQTVVGGVRFDTGGTSILGAADLATLSCPSECAGGGGTVTSGPRPVAIDLDTTKVGSAPAQRLLIGADNSNVLTVVELDETTSLPESIQPVALEDTSGALGITAVALAPQIGMGGSNGTINDDIAAGGKFNFAYAITTDDTIRVVALNGAVEAGGGGAADFVECDTQVDPRLINSNRNVRELSCFPVGRPGTPARRPGVHGPGVELPGDGVPQSIEIFRAADLVNDTRTPGPSKLVGYFGVISASNGATFVLNVDDDDYADFEDTGAPLQVQMPLAIAHQLRDEIPGRDLLAETEEDGQTKPLCDTFGPDPDGQGGNAGGTRSTSNPSRNVGTGAIAPEKTPELPYIRQLACTGADATLPVSELAFAAPAAVRDLEYPDLRAARDETWTLTWEGTLSNDKGDTDIDGPAVRTSQVFVDSNGMRIVDPSQPFCDAGVETHDIVQLRGCDPAQGDAQCPLGYTCFVHPQSQLAGLGACMLDDEADRLADACKDYLISTRRYTVGRSAAGELKLLPRKVVLRTTPADGCVDDDQCEALAEYAADLTSSTHPRNDTTPDADKRRWSCRADADRPPLDGPGQTGKRCIAVCTQTSDCATGHVCQNGVCMEGVVPPQACVNAPQRYDLRAHEAFTVLGTSSGYVHSTIKDPATGRCIADPNAHPFEVGRIPLDPPACDPTADPRTGRRPDGSFEPNPCALTVEHTESVPVYTDDQCTLGSPSSTLATRQASAIRFRNRGLTLTMVDPFYPGDATCTRDRQGTLVKVPTVFSGYQLAWRQTAGFDPLTLRVTPAFPVRVVKGPTESIWVIDEGDLLSNSLSTASTRGKVFRVESQNLGQINILE